MRQTLFLTSTMAVLSGFLTSKKICEGVFMLEEEGELGGDSSAGLCRGGLDLKSRL